MDKIIDMDIVYSGELLPEYATVGSSGMDVRVNATSLKEINQFDVGARIEERSGGFILPSLGRVVIPSGVKVAIPQGYEIQVRSRSGLSLKKGLIVVQGVGTIDSDYRNEIGICIANISAQPQRIEWGERIAQIVLIKVEKIAWNPVEELDETDRGLGGFGSTGKH